MPLPHAALARVDREKVRGYLLNADHQYGASKARFFGQFGFTVEAWETLACALQRHGRTHTVISSTRTECGTRHEVDGELHTPDGRRPFVRTVWQVDTKEIAPRLITAYPLRRGAR